MIHGGTIAPHLGLASGRDGPAIATEGITDIFPNQARYAGPSYVNLRSLSEPPCGVGYHPITFHERHGFLRVRPRCKRPAGKPSVAGAWPRVAHSGRVGPGTPGIERTDPVPHPSHVPPAFP